MKLAFKVSSYLIIYTQDASPVYEFMKTAKI